MHAYGVLDFVAQYPGGTKASLWMIYKDYKPPKKVKCYLLYY